MVKICSNRTVQGGGYSKNRVCKGSLCPGKSKKFTMVRERGVGKKWGQRHPGVIGTASKSLLKHYTFYFSLVTRPFKEISSLCIYIYIYIHTNILVSRISHSVQHLYICVYILYMCGYIYICLYIIFMCIYTHIYKCWITMLYPWN